jgi:FkbM family methyltransferase
MIEKLKRIYRKLFRNPPKYRIDSKINSERHGSLYGGWNIIPAILDQNSIVYSIGIGRDISFDLSIISQYKCQIFAYDPTPEVKTWINGQNIPREFIFHPVGLSSEDGFLKFYTPKEKGHISHSAFANDNSLELEVASQRLKTMMMEHKHNHIDLLKMDIEGFEYSIIDDLIECDIKPKQLLIEFHHFFPQVGNDRTEEAIQKLKDYGYQLYYVSNSFCEYSLKHME